MSDYRPTLIVPGLRGSGENHWQSWWQGQDRNALRVVQDDWETPNLNVWAGKVLQAVEQARSEVWIVAHSFGCLASLYAAQKCGASIGGLFLVAPADPVKFGVDALMPRYLDTPSVMVASRTDPWLRFAAAHRWAEQLDSQFVDLGDAGHINIESGYGPWQQGLNMFCAFQRRIKAESLLGSFLI